MFWGLLIVAIMALPASAMWSLVERLPIEGADIAGLACWVVLMSAFGVLGLWRAQRREAVETAARREAPLTDGGFTSPCETEEWRHNDIRRRWLAAYPWVERLRQGAVFIAFAAAIFGFARRYWSPAHHFDSWPFVANLVAVLLMSVSREPPMWKLSSRAERPHPLNIP